jgi:uncharacterized protein (TIGR03435 family)
MRVHLVLIAAVFFMSSLAVTAQTAHEPEFDVATVKAVVPAPPGQPININLGTIRNGRVTLNNVTLNDCIKFAYNIVSDAQVFGPDWIKSDVRFDIVGQASADTPPEQLLLMLQRLLADRLKLQLHRDKRELPFLALVVGKNGHKLLPSKENNDVSPRTVAGRITANRMRIPVLAMLLSRFERITVVDLTERQGQFAIDLQWTTDAIRRLAPPDGGPIRINGEQVDPNGPTIYTAIQEQLGLRLDARKGPIDVIVVDSAEKIPTEN